MSASEKLERLHEDQLREGRWPTFPGGEDVLDALPEIIAVVKAAERLQIPTFESNAWYDVYENLPDLLAALDRKLEEK